MLIMLNNAQSSKRLEQKNKARYIEWFIRHEVNHKVGTICTFLLNAEKPARLFEPASAQIPQVGDFCCSVCLEEAASALCYIQT